MLPAVVSAKLIANSRLKVDNPPFKDFHSSQRNMVSISFCSFFSSSPLAAVDALEHAIVNSALISYSK